MEASSDSGARRQHEVVAALVIQQPRVLLGHRAAARVWYPNVWDLFGGHVEPGEQPHETLIRELDEELGIRPRDWDFVETLDALLDDRPDAPPTRIIQHLFVVRAWRGTPVNRQPEEHAAIRWCTHAQALQLDLANPDYYRALFDRFLDRG